MCLVTSAVADSRCADGQVAGLKVKCMLAEPKGKRGRTDSAWSDSASPALHVRHIDMALTILHEQLASFCMKHSAHLQVLISRAPLVINPWW